jgi:hypothetical protein
MNAAQEQATAEEAEREMLADVVRDALLTRYPGPVRPVHRVILARLLREDGASAILAGIDAVREVAARGESREIALESFVWALMREKPAPLSPGGAWDDPAAVEAIRTEHVQRVGADAYLLERMAADRLGYAEDATGIDPTEAVQAATDAEGLRALAIRHAVHHARRDVLPRPPFASAGSGE